MIAEIALLISVVLNALLAFYCTRVARRLFVVGANMETIYQSLYIFRSHVEQVHEAEMFYGDQTLQALIEHSTETLSVLDTYQDLMEMVVIEDMEGENGKEEE